MRISIGYSGATPVAETVPTVIAAELAGLDGVWSAEHVGLNDAVVPSVVYATSTSALEIGMLGMNADTRHPGLLAMELVTLASLAPGRVRIQIGTGSPIRAARLGITQRRPIETVDAFVRALRSLLAGEETTLQWDTFSLAGLSLNVSAPPIPIDVMAIRPRMTELATRIADGVSLSAGASRDYLAGSEQRVSALLHKYDRPREAFRVSAAVFACVAEDLPTARRTFAQVACRFPFASAPELQSGVALPDLEAVDAALAQGGTVEAAALFTDDVIDGLGLVATPATFADAVERYRATGIDEIVVMPIGSAANHLEVVQLLANVH